MSEQALRLLLQEILDHIEHDPDCWSESCSWQSSTRESLIERIKEALAS